MNMKISKGGFSKSRSGRGKKDTRKIKKNSSENKKSESAFGTNKSPSMFVEHRNR